MGKLTLAVAQPQPEAGECYYLQRDGSLEELANDPNPAKGVDGIHFFVESPDQSEMRFIATCWGSHHLCSCHAISVRTSLW